MRLCLEYANYLMKQIVLSWEGFFVIGGNDPIPARCFPAVCSEWQTINLDSVSLLRHSLFLLLPFIFFSGVSYFKGIILIFSISTFCIETSHITNKYLQTEHRLSTVIINFFVLPIDLVSSPTYLVFFSASWIRIIWFGGLLHLRDAVSK